MVTRHRPLIGFIMTHLLWQDSREINLKLGKKKFKVFTLVSEKNIYYNVCTSKWINCVFSQLGGSFLSSANNAERAVSENIWTKYWMHTIDHTQHDTANHTRCHTTQDAGQLVIKHSTLRLPDAGSQTPPYTTGRLTKHEHRCDHTRPDVGLRIRNTTIYDMTPSDHTFYHTHSDAGLRITNAAIHDRMPGEGWPHMLPYHTRSDTGRRMTTHSTIHTRTPD